MAGHIDGHGISVGHVGAGNGCKDAVICSLQNVHQTVQNRIGYGQDCHADDHGGGTGVADLSHDGDSENPAAKIEPGLVLAGSADFYFLDNRTGKQAEAEIQQFCHTQCQRKSARGYYQNLGGKCVQIHESNHDCQGQQRITSHCPDFFFTAGYFHRDPSLSFV